MASNSSQRDLPLVDQDKNQLAGPSQTAETETDNSKGTYSNLIFPYTTWLFTYLHIQCKIWPTVSGILAIVNTRWNNFVQWKAHQTVVLGVILCWAVSSIYIICTVQVIFIGDFICLPKLRYMLHTSMHWWVLVSLQCLLGRFTFQSELL